MDVLSIVGVVLAFVAVLGGNFVKVVLSEPCLMPRRTDRHWWHLGRSHIAYLL